MMQNKVLRLENNMATPPSSAQTKALLFLWNILAQNFPAKQNLALKSVFKHFYVHIIKTGKAAVTDCLPSETKAEKHLSEFQTTETENFLPMQENRNNSHCGAQSRNPIFSAPEECSVEKTTTTTTKLQILNFNL